MIKRNKQQMRHGIPVFETGGSVTTTALDIALKFSAKQIIFVGVDLAYHRRYFARKR